MKVNEKWVNERVKVYPSGQLFFSGKPITSVYNENEKRIVIGDLTKMINNPRLVGVNNPIDAVEEVHLMHTQRRLLNKSPYEQYKERIANSPNLFYKTSKKISGLSFTNSFNDIFQEMTASKLLDICSDLQNGRDRTYINQQYCESLEDDFSLIIYAWSLGKLNQTIHHICSRSKQVGGYIDHFNGVTIRNREANQYTHKEVIMDGVED